MSAPSRWPAIWSAFRIAAATLIAAAIVAQASRTIGGAVSGGRDVAMTTVNFFSFFLVTNPVTKDPWWYPYPFLDPHLVGGYGGVALYVVGIAVALGAVAALVVAVGRRRSGVEPA